MPTGGDFITRVNRVDGGLYDKANPLLIGEQHASAVDNFNFNRETAEEAYGIRRLNPDRPRPGGVRCTPSLVRGTAADVTSWRDGHVFVPCSQRMHQETIKQIDAVVRVEEDFAFPGSGAGRREIFTGGLTGRYVPASGGGTQPIYGVQRIGGEHQFFPVISRGARETEEPSWGLGIGVIAPQGMRDTADADIAEPDRVVPVFYWWSTAGGTSGLRVSAADVAIVPGVEFGLTVDLTNQQWYVNGSAVSTISTAALGLSSLPTSVQGTEYPIYMGRGYAREPNVQYAAPYDVKHAHMGKYNCNVSGAPSGSAGAITIPAANNELAFSVGVASSYLGYRLRMVTGTAAGKIYRVTGSTNPTNDATITITIDAPLAHGISSGDDFDFVPAVEPVPIDATIQECRIWKVATGALTIATLNGVQAYSDKTSNKIHKNVLRSLTNSNESDLIAYWPMDEDGGVVVRDRLGKSDGYFGPSLPQVDTSDVASSSPRALHLDGATTAVQCDMRKDPNWGRNYSYNLGTTLGDKSHWNYVVRMQFKLGSTTIGTSSGSIEDHPYEVLSSIGDPQGGTPLFEVRVAKFPSRSIYFALPDGTYQTLSLLDEDTLAHEVQVGSWYNAVFGIQSFDEAANPRRHYCYFQAFDATLQPIADFSTAFNLPADASVSRKVDPSREYLISFGASVRGDEDRGSGDNNHAMISMACLGYGFHPVNFIPSGLSAPISGIAGSTRLAHFDEITEREECSPLVGGQGQGASLTKDSDQLTVSGGSPILAELPRWHMDVPHIDLVYREKGEADIRVPDALMIQSVAGTSATLSRSYTGSSVEGVELRVKLWTGYTSFEMLETPEDTGVNMGIESDERWARTDGLFRDIAGSNQGFDFAVDPTYEHTSPLRIAPRWFYGLVFRADIEVAGLTHYKKSDGNEAILAAIAGSLYECDERWRQGDMFREANRSFAFRRRNSTDRRVQESSQRGAMIFSAATRTYRNEALEIPQNSLSGSLNVELAELATPAALNAFQMEAEVCLDGLDGRRTIAARARTTYSQKNGTAPVELCFQKNFHWYIDNGHQVFEIRDDALGVGLLYRCREREQSTLRIRPGVWHRLMVELQLFWSGSANFIRDIRFFCDGKRVDTEVQFPTTDLLLSSVPTSGMTTTTLGSIGRTANMPFVDALGGKMGLFVFRAGFGYGSTGVVGDEYEPVELLRDGTELAVTGSVAVIDFAEGQGTRLNCRFDNTSVGDQPVPFIGNVLVPVGHGMSYRNGNPVSFQTFGDVLYVNNFISRPWRYDMDEMTSNGLMGPAGKLKSVEVDRKALRVKDRGADVPGSIGSGNRTLVATASPHLSTFVGAAPNPSAQDVGCLVSVPADYNMGSATEWYGGYIGVVDSADSTAVDYDLRPAPASQYATAGTDASWMLNRTAKDIAATNVDKKYKRAISSMPKSTTPWGATRLMPDGKNNVGIPTEEDLSSEASNTHCISLQGNQYIEFPPFIADKIPVDDGTVLEVKTYIRLDDVDIYGDDEQVIAEQSADGETAAWRIVVFDGGRIKFSFFDVSLGAERWIQTFGACLTANQWYYFRFRYKFKNTGAHVFDTRGGWEPDLRWTVRGGAARYSLEQGYRDGLWVYACEGYHKRGTPFNADTAVSYDGDAEEVAACPFLTLPGCESQVGGTRTNGFPATTNHSQHLLNVGLLKDAPYITPERGDSLFPLPNSASPVESGVELTLSSNTFASVASSVTNGNALVPANFVLPRTCSMNRDDAWNRQQDAAVANSSQLFLESGAPLGNFWNQTIAASVFALANQTDFTPNLANQGLGTGDTYGQSEGWAVLCRVWRLVTVGTLGAVGAPGDRMVTANGSGGTGVAGTHTGDAARVLALVHIGSSDLGNSARGGTAGHGVFLTDDVIYGGDGLGALRVGAGIIANNASVHVTFELMNGENQSVASDNRNVVPTLLEQGSNPVGDADSPDNQMAAIRIGGSIEQGNRRRVRSGLRGRLDDFAMGAKELSVHATNTYTPDTMPPDAFFHGPSDTRFQSLPKLAMTDSGNNTLDVATGSVARPTLAVHFDEQSGSFVGKSSDSSGIPPHGRVVTSGDTLQAEGEHRLRVTFYDPKQNRESAPGPEFLVDISTSGHNDILEAASTMAIDGIPISGDRREKVWRRIYKTLPNGGLPLLWAEIRDNTTTSMSPRAGDNLLALGKSLEFDNREAPICRALRANEGNMFYGGLDDAPNVITYSKAFEPEHVPGDQILFAESSKGGRITAIGYLRGQLIPAKKNALFIAFPSGATFRLSRVGQDIGCISPNGFADMDGALYFPTLKGVYTFLGNQRTFDASASIERLYREDLDLRTMEQSSGAAYLDRSQYLLTAKLKSDEDPKTLLAAEKRFDQFGNIVYAWTKHSPGVPMYSVASYEDNQADQPRAIIGGRGWVYLHDTGTGIGVNGVQSTVTGSLVGLVNAASSGVGQIFLDGLNATFGGFDTNQGGLAGYSILLLNETDIDGNVVAAGTGSTFNVLLHDEILLSTNASGTTGRIYPFSNTIDYNSATYDNALAIVGGRTFDYRTRWFESISPETNKAYDYLDIMFTPSSGVVFVEIYCDYDEGTLARTARIPLTRGYYAIALAGLNARTLQIRFRSYGVRQGFELLQYVLRALPHAHGKRMHT